MEKKKVALLFICLNANYWPFLKDVVEDAKKHFLPGHQVDIYAWSDMPELNTPEYDAVLQRQPTLADIQNKGSILAAQPPSPQRDNALLELNKIQPREVLEEAITYLRTQENIHVIPTEPVQWPYPTLMRYHLFLGQEKALKDYDYLFYLDVDMRVVDTVGDEILGEGITMAEHPMYALRKEYVPPYEPNKDSTAYIPRFGCVLNENGKPRFKPLYAAGGFQGGTTQSFLDAMKYMKANIDKDMTNNYVAIWNDESHWNKFLYGYTGHIVVLSPSYIYPDSLIEEYYVKVWGTNYWPKIVTLTKKFTTSKENGDDLRKRLTSM